MDQVGFHFGCFWSFYAFMQNREIVLIFKFHEFLLATQHHRMGNINSHKILKLLLFEIPLHFIISIQLRSIHIVYENQNILILYYTKKLSK